jgi:hypothetical protein
MRDTNFIGRSITCVRSRTTDARETNVGRLKGYNVKSFDRCALACRVEFRCVCVARIKSVRLRQGYGATIFALELRRARKLWLAESKLAALSFQGEKVRLH